MVTKLDPKFKDEVTSVPGGKNIKRCFQCGTCSASCPMWQHMDALPRKIMHMAQLGMKEEIEKKNTSWICSSCHTCNVRCPRGVDLPKVMEALRLMTLRKNKNYIEPSQLSEEIVKESPQIAMVAGFRKLTG